MSAPITLTVHASDPLSEAGIVGQLRHEHDLAFLPGDSAQPPDVAVVVADVVDEHTADVIRRVRRRRSTSVVLVVAVIDGRGVLAAVDAGVTGIVRRVDATAVRLVEAVHGAATGAGVIPPDLLGRLLRQDGRPAAAPSAHGPRLTYGGLSRRELTVLRLVADGYSTTEIAAQLAYSERTVKNALHDLTSRFQLRNRSHAVAFAVREGLI